MTAGHRQDRTLATELLADPDPRVRATALGALARAGGLDAATWTLHMDDPHAAVRRRACEEAGRDFGHEQALERGEETSGRPGDARRRLEEALEDPDPAVAEAAAWALGELGPRGRPAVGSLVALTAGESAACREAAVAALGAIGDPAGLPAVLGALSDRPPIRRRATVALAGFDDERAVEGLHWAAADRDWQVRQAAEELLGDT